MPVKAEDITDFCAQFARSELREVHFKTDDVEIFLSKDPDAAGLSALPRTQPEAADPEPAVSGDSAAEKFDIRAPIFGTLRLDGGDGEEPPIKAGRRIGAGEVIAYIEVLGERTPIKAERPGEIVEIYAEPDALVDFDATLFTLGPSE